MQVDTGEILAWLGPAIGPAAFEVGQDVHDIFTGQDAACAAAFTPHGSKWLCDLYHLARLRLNRAGVTAIYGGDRCTFSEPDNFFSYRRDGRTGRMASLIWIE
jgi:YfiH family protein